MVKINCVMEVGMLKRLSVVCMIMFVLGLMSGFAFGQSYCRDVLETGNPGGRG